MIVPQLFTTHVNVAAFAEHPDRHCGKYYKSQNQFPHHLSSQKKALPQEGRLQNCQASILGVNIDVFGFLDEQGANDQGQPGNDDGIPQTAVNIAFRRNNRE